MYGLSSIYYDDATLFHGSLSILMGTRFDMIVAGESREKMEGIWTGICREAARLERMFNRFDPLSEVSEVNAGMKEPSPEMQSIIGICNGYATRTKGYFDITKGSRFSEGKVQYDFGGFAKGYLLKQIKESFCSNGINDAFVDFGQSSILAMGNHPSGDGWTVSLRSPFRDRAPKEIALHDKALSVSGNSPGYVGHIVNPFTGEEQCGSGMVAVISEDPLDAEVLSTALMVIPKEDASAVLTGFPDVETMIFE